MYDGVLSLYVLLTVRFGSRTGSGSKVGVLLATAALVLTAPDAAASAGPGTSEVAELTPSPNSTPDPTASDDATPEPDPTPPTDPTATPQPDPTTTQSPTLTPTPTPTRSPTPTPAPTPTPTPEPDAGESETLRIQAGTPAVIPTANRLAGADRYATSVAVSKAAFPNGADAVLLAAGNAPVDGVIAAGLAAAHNAPLLYIVKGGVPAAVANELRRLAPSQIIVLGGQGVVSSVTLKSLRDYAPRVTRFGGLDRYTTSQAALTGSGGSFPTVYLAGGRGVVDPPLAFAAAAANGQGGMLVNGLAASADSATIAALRAVGAQRLVLVGGLGTISKSYESSLRKAGFATERRTGADRYATAVLMAKERTTGAKRLIVANSLTFPDVAVAAALAGATGQPLLYAIEKCMPDSVAAYARSAGAAITGVGGPAWLGANPLAGKSCTMVKTEGESALATAIRSTMSRYQGWFTVTVREIGGLGQQVNIASGERREPASMMKIFAAWAALERIEHGRASFGTTLPSGVSLGGCLYVMIHASDNFCHSDIVHWIGIAEINRMIRAEGFPNTFYGSVPSGVSVLYAGNRSTANDLSYMMVRLHSGTILNRSLSDHLLNLMRAQIFRTRIASGIPPGVRQATKPGSLWLTSGLMQGDTGIVWGPKSTYAISIIGDDGPPQAALRAISRTVYEHFNGSFGTAMTYPVEQVVTIRGAALRSTPGGSTVYVAPAGTPLQVIDANRIWYQVQWGQRKLWVWYEDLRNR